MSNPWAQSFEDLRSPYLQEKKAKKDYDGDGKIESGAKEYRGVVHNKIQKAKGGKADGQDTSSVKEHHQKDANGNPVEHGDGTPSNVDEAKIDQIDPKNKRNRRNIAKFGKQTKPYDPPGKAYKNEMGKFLQKQRKERHDKMRGVKTKGMKEEVVNEEDKKGKGSGKKDACYHKVKASASVWPSAYASGRLVQCRKKGAANYGKGSKKESYEFQIPLKSFEQMVGECWKTHEQRGMKKKGNRMVPNCVPKGSPRKEEVAYEAVKNPKLDIKETGVKNKIEINPEIKTEAAKAPEKK